MCYKRYGSDHCRHMDAHLFDLPVLSHYDPCGELDAAGEKGSTLHDCLKSVSAQRLSCILISQLTCAAHIREVLLMPADSLALWAASLERATCTCPDIAGMLGFKLQSAASLESAICTWPAASAAALLHCFIFQQCPAGGQAIGKHPGKQSSPAACIMWQRVVHCLQGHSRKWHMSRTLTCHTDRSDRSTAFCAPSHMTLDEAAHCQLMSPYLWPISKPACGWVPCPKAAMDSARQDRASCYCDE